VLSLAAVPVVIASQETVGPMEDTRRRCATVRWLSLWSGCLAALSSGSAQSCLWSPGRVVVVVTFGETLDSVDSSSQTHNKELNSRKSQQCHRNRNRNEEESKLTQIKEKQKKSKMSENKQRKRAYHNVSKSDVDARLCHVLFLQHRVLVLTLRITTTNQTKKNNCTNMEKLQNKSKY
jgi:hypothetical protein